MPISIVAILMLAGPVALALLVVGAIAMLGMMAYDVATSRKSERVSAEVEDVAVAHDAAERRIYLERGVARAFVILGGAFWAIAAFAGLYSFQNTGVAAAMLAASVPLFASLATLVVGWYWERLTSVLLAIASVAVVAWGVTYQFEMGVWILMTLALIGPMVTASALFWMARRDQEALELSLAAHREPAYATVSSR